jgi:hypothetical protein
LSVSGKDFYTTSLVSSVEHLDAKNIANMESILLKRQEALELQERIARSSKQALKEETKHSLVDDSSEETVFQT